MWLHLMLIWLTNGVCTHGMCCVLKFLLPGIVGLFRGQCKTRLLKHISPTALTLRYHSPHRMQNICALCVELLSAQFSRRFRRFTRSTHYVLSWLHPLTAHKASALSALSIPNLYIRRERGPIHGIAVLDIAVRIWGYIFFDYSTGFFNSPLFRSGYSVVGV